MLIHLIFLGVILASAHSECPAKYTRFSLQHSFCLDQNATCNILKKGVDKDDRKTILRVHNKLRSKIATGKENRAGGLPAAANMIQMEWDTELASIAQKWTEQCNFAHDCGDCRRVENFYSTGENMAKHIWPKCKSSDCSDVKPDWKSQIREFYNEVQVFDKKYIKPFAFAEDWGHFTQVVWAKTWKVGCGVTTFWNGTGAISIYACNYGPGGNDRGKALYEAGPVSSACPSNTCSGCKIKGPTYPGLCKVRNLSLGPVYENKDAIYDCNWREERSSCQVEQKGTKGWKVKRTLDGGSYETITLKGGEKSELALVTPLQPKGKPFCINFQFRKGPAIASEKDSSKLSFVLNVPAGQVSQSFSLEGTTTTGFNNVHSTMPWEYETKIAIKVEIPPNAPDHIIDIKDITVYDGKCKK